MSMKGKPQEEIDAAVEKAKEQFKAGGVVGGGGAGGQNKAIDQSKELKEAQAKI